MKHAVLSVRFGRTWKENAHGMRCHEYRKLFKRSPLNRKKCRRALLQRRCRGGRFSRTNTSRKFANKKCCSASVSKLAGA